MKKISLMVIISGAVLALFLLSAPDTCWAGSPERSDLATQVNFDSDSESAIEFNIKVTAIDRVLRALKDDLDESGRKQVEEAIYSGKSISDIRQRLEALDILQSKKIDEIIAIITSVMEEAAPEAAIAEGAMREDSERGAAKEGDVLDTSAGELTERIDVIWADLSDKVSLYVAERRLPLVFDKPEDLLPYAGKMAEEFYEMSVSEESSPEEKGAFEKAAAAVQQIIDRVRVSTAFMAMDQRPAEETKEKEAEEWQDIAYVSAQVKRASDIGEEVRRASEKRQKGEKHIIFVTKAIPQSQEIDVEEVKDLCRSYYMKLGYTIDFTDGYEGAQEILEIHDDYMIENTIIGFIDNGDLYMGKKEYRVLQELSKGSRMVSMRPARSDQYVPIKPFFDLMATLVNLNREDFQDEGVIQSVRRLVDAVSPAGLTTGAEMALRTAAILDDPIGFARRFVIFLPQAQRLNTRELRELYDISVEVLQSM